MPSFEELGFGVGDVVICLTNEQDGVYVQGKTYTIECDDLNGLFVQDLYVRRNGRCATWGLVKKSEFPPVPEYQVGDIVFFKDVNYPMPFKVTVLNGTRVSIESDFGQILHQVSKTQLSAKPFPADDYQVYDHLRVKCNRNRYVYEYNTNLEARTFDGDAGEPLNLDDIYTKDSVLKAWGMPIRAIPYLHDYQYSLGSSKLSKFLLRHGFCGLRMLAFQPTPSKLVEGQISIWEDIGKCTKNRKTSLKDGRAFRKMFPELTDKQLAALVDDYRREFPVHFFTLVESREREDFKKAYSHDMETYDNIYTTSQRKSLANSCMRHGFSHLPAHPAEAYASGEFSIFYTVSKRDRIGSRCVVWWGKDGKTPVAGPVYGVTEVAIDTIENKLKEIGADLVTQGHDWEGAQLLDIPCGSRSKVLPYLDCGIRWADENLVISNTKKGYDLSSYNGEIHLGSGLECHYCEERIDEDYDSWDEIDGRIYCSCCRDDMFSWCEHYEEYVSNDEINTVYYRGRWGVSTMNVCDSALENSGDYVYCDSDGQWWKDDCVTYVNGEAVDPLTLSEKYFQSDKDGEYHPDDTMITIEENGVLLVVSTEEIDEDDYEKGDDGIYREKEQGEAA